ncbi:tRNA pseudouridine(55) synthase TruB [Parasphingopyxis marina]|uniref:tRNA pseudouridine synthase B n=1 Tax=Parasphingopyxis marina TaxID=2761622 RepID=A0A842I3W7_9SPHN|nr:tRNA pseudouridine(55) synthase TruB [Parasphingopyxis marina]MBC2779190.1 tRNA pseudouridine(55) synthase TruB [Parasphingopyxis marina]
MDEAPLKPALHGWLVIDKPVGIGSTPCVAAVKRALREGRYAKAKVGHGGTLDPLASGVLPIAIGEATKLAGRMLDSDKIYAFTIRFGEETETLDAEGDVTETSENRPTLAEIETALPSFTGAIDQVPPKYSALKIDGRPAYARARAGEDVTIETRQVTIHHLAIESPPKPGIGLNEITLAAHVSKGTYIRSLARDIARALDTRGTVTMLHRIKAGPFTLEGAISLDKLAEIAKEQRLEQALLPLTAGLDDIPALTVAPDQARQLQQGQRVIGVSATAGLYLATDQSVPVALVESDGIELKVVRGFNL